MNTQTKVISLILLALVIIGGVYLFSQMKTSAPATGSPTPAAVQLLAQANYSCNQGKTIEARFYRKTGPAPSVEPGQPPIPTGSVNVQLSDGRVFDLNQTISADGSRYANAGESFVFWSKGNGALVLENNQEKSFIGCVRVAAQPAGSDLTKIYSNGADSFSIRLPQNYTIDESYNYELKPGEKIGGVKFTIPASLTAGTNLSTDTYLSVEFLPRTENCAANLFLEGNNTAKEQTIDGQTYSVASATGAAAGNRYEETVYAIPGTNPCVAVRYFVHYGAIQNYPPLIKEFEKQALLNQFGQIRKTLVTAP